MMRSNRLSDALRNISPVPSRSQASLTLYCVQISLIIRSFTFRFPSSSPAT